MADEHEADWELVMPFVACASQGGPYADEPFVAGFHLGQIDMALAGQRALWTEESDVHWIGDVREASLPQLDLIAMRHGLAVLTSAPAEDGWRSVVVGRPEADL